MPRATYKISKFAKQKRWRKKYKGQQLYFPFADYPTAEDAWQAFLKRKAEIDLEAQATKPHRREYDHAIQQRRNLAEYCRGTGELDQAKIFEAEAEALLSKFSRATVPPPLTKDEADPLSSITAQALQEIRGRQEGEFDPDDFDKIIWHNQEVAEVRAVWADRLERYDAADQGPETVRATVASFLDQKKAKMEAGELSVARWAKLRKHLETFTDWIGSTRSMENVATSKTLLDWHSHLLQRIKNKELGNQGAWDHMVSVKQLIRWAWEIDLCDLPRKLGSKDLGFKLSAKSVPTFTVKELETLWNGSVERTQLYIALALNCGFTQVDISDLLKSELDLVKGTITRKRSKTKDQENVPVVCYKLWTVTAELIEKCQNDEGDLVFTNRNGFPLRREWIGEDGKYKKSDTVRSAFSKVARRNKIAPQFKVLRKTGSTKLDEHPIYRTITDLYLGHSPRSIKDRHYTAPPQQLLDEAVTWLGTQFTFAETATPRNQ